MKLLLLLMLAGAVTAQTKAPPRQRPVGPEAAAWRLESVTVEGNLLYSKEKILQVARLAPGQMAGKAEFEAARDRLVASGYFESVAYRFDPVEGQPAIRGVLQVSEIAQTYPWRLDDVPVTRDEFLAALKDEALLGGKVPASDPLTKRLSARLEELLKSKGVEEPVTARLMPESGGEMVVVFRPRRAPPAIAEIGFTGTQVWTDAELRKQLASVAIGTVYGESTFRELLNNMIRPMYEAKGHMRVEFTRIATRPAVDVNGLAVEVEVRDGEAYKLASVTVRGTPFSDEENQRIGEFKLDETINYSAVGIGLRKINEALKEAGYLKPDSKVSRRINDTSRTVNVYTDFVPGTRYRFRKLEVKGLDLITEPVIRKLWALKEGEPFRNSYPQYFLDRVRADGIFDDLGETKFEVKMDDAAGAVDVTLFFSGSQPETGKGPRRGRQ